MTTSAYPVSPPPAATRKPRTGAAITGLVLGIIALAGSPIPILNNATIIAGIIAVPFAIIGIFGLKRGTSIAGLVMAIAGIVIGIALQVQWGKQLDRIGDDFNTKMSQIPTAPAMPNAVAPTLTPQVQPDVWAGATEATPVTPAAENTVSVPAPVTKTVTRAPSASTNSIPTWPGLLNYGDCHPALRQFQLKLNDLGFDFQGTSCYAGKTLSAVHTLETRYGLPQQDTISPELWYTVFYATS